MPVTLRTNPNPPPSPLIPQPQSRAPSPSGFPSPFQVPAAPIRHAAESGSERRARRCRGGSRPQCTLSVTLCVRARVHACVPAGLCQCVCTSIGPLITIVPGRVTDQTSVSLPTHGSVTAIEKGTGPDRHPPMSIDARFGAIPRQMSISSFWGACTMRV